MGAFVMDRLAEHGLAAPGSERSTSAATHPSSACW